jgi:hypothetical protein
VELIVEGCTDANACNYNATSNTNDGSCYNNNLGCGCDSPAATDGYDCDGNCLVDTDGDQVCDEFEIVGCQDPDASNYNEEATDPGDCISWQEAFDSCIESGGDDGIGQDDVNAAYEAGLIDGDDGVSQDDVDNAAATAYEQGVASVTPEDGIGQDDVDAAYAAGAASVTPEDGITQADLDAAYAAGLASVTPEDGIGQDDVDNAAATAYEQGVASVTPEDGIGQDDLDAAYAAGAASVTPEDGIGQDDVDVLQALLDEALANNSGGSCEPIYIDLLQGWNIMGYTLPFAQDVTATLVSIVDNIEIVKNNAAEVYWPEFSFNGIGDFIPGQGYQIRMYNNLNGYTFPDVGGQRIELTPTVPQWAIDMKVETHPNDIRSLVRVINMLGQEVDPERQIKGTVLLYLYNDATVKKKIVE